MWILYLLGVRAYGFIIRLSSLFGNEKAKAWIEGRRGWHRSMSQKFAGVNEKRIWFHCASLGEFEQGRPLLEALRKEYSDYKIVLTFFSPSGYKVRKNEPLADYVFYMPLDGLPRSKKFLDLVKPSMVFFVKYEFWYFYGKELHSRKIPYFCVSAIFRPGQVFFHSLGDFFRKMLTRFTHLFVQDQDSLQLLYKNRITNVTVAGDTRFDRVNATAKQATPVPGMEKFCAGNKVMICGSTWPLDDEVVRGLINSNRHGLKYVIAPHEINSQNLSKLRTSIKLKSKLYSEWMTDDSQDCDVLLIDNVGMLSRLYQYGHYAYVGGGFGSGIHNILEAVVFGLPVFFGPKYERFREACDLVKSKGAFPVKNSAELIRCFDSLENDESFYKKVSETNKRYVEGRKGATEVIMNYLRMNYPAN